MQRKCVYVVSLGSYYNGDELIFENYPNKATLLKAIGVLYAFSKEKVRINNLCEAIKSEGEIPPIPPGQNYVNLNWEKVRYSSVRKSFMYV